MRATTKQTNDAEIDKRSMEEIPKPYFIQRQMHHTAQTAEREVEQSRTQIQRSVTESKH